MKKINEVYETKDYNQFKFLANNRDINIKHVNKLVKSMKERRLVSPILVNELGEIIDGQHRFEAQKSLKMPVPYIIQNGYKEKEAQILNINTSNWTLNTWVKFYCREGIKDYIYIEILKRNISLKMNNVAFCLLDIIKDKHL